MINLWNRNDDLKDIEKRIRVDGEKIDQEIIAGRVEPDINNLRIGEARSFELAVLHIDIVNFTRLTGDLNNKSKLGFLNTFQSEMTRIVHDYDGVVEKYTGDRVTA